MRLTSYLLIPFFGLLVSQLFSQNCVCTNCPQFMPDNFVGDFFINVMGATNNNLADPGQGVCGVSISMEHEYIGDIKIMLTSPAGQMVTLIGPVGLFGDTDFSTWNISFVPCADVAVPDNGFTPTWNNNQPWGTSGTYTGSYFPQAGCLENFNTGPVNGNWTLNVVDGQANDVGTFFNYEIIFCDGSGISCVSCAANAGNLLQPDVTACEGAASLDLTLPPTYATPNVPPPAATYTYTYVISQNGIIIDYDPTANLTGLPAGNYSVCGLSYITTAENDLPAPNGTLTVAQLTQQLNSNQAPFCGDITQNCVNVIINVAPDDVDQTEIVCFGECVTFFGTTYCNSGTYVRNLTTPQGCPYVATLRLTRLPQETEMITQVICDGECSTVFGFEGYCASGNYTEQFVNPISGCDSFVTVSLNVLIVNAVIQPPAALSCSTLQVILNSTGSTTGGGITYQWSGPGIVGPSTNPTCTVNQPGTYKMILKKTFGGVFCLDSTEVVVITTAAPPAVPANVTGTQLVCPGQSFTYTAASVAGASSYNWTLPAGASITNGQNTNQITVLWANTGGNLCASAVNSCGVSAPVCLLISLGIPPAIPIVAGNDTICGNATEVYSIPTVAGATAWNWTVPAGATIAQGQNSGSITINWGNSTGGQVCATVSNACGASPAGCLTVLGGQIPTQPTVSGSPTACLNIPQNYSVNNQAGISFSWTVSNGGTITLGQNTNQISVNWTGNATTGTVCCTTNNFCGNSPQGCFSVSLGSAPTSPDLGGIQPICVGENFTYSVQNVPNATTYNWTIPAGQNLVSGQSTNTINVSFLVAPGGNICVTAGNICGASQPDCQPAIVAAVPTPNAGTNGSICGQTINLVGTQSIAASNLAWSQASGLGIAAFSNPTSSNTQVTVNQYGSYVFYLKETNGNCEGLDSVVILFNNAPSAGSIATTCNGSNTNYTITFPISGGQSPYSVSGGNVTGNIFTSNPVVSGQNFNYTISDANGCMSAVISGVFNCNCTTTAGNMSQTTLTACEGEIVTATAPINAVLDGNDVASFVLHGNSGTSLGTIFGQNLTGVFDFQAGMNYGQTYYISYFVGDNLGGFPDPADGCRSVAQGTPVIFYKKPVAKAGIDRDTCGNTMQLNASPSVGFGTWSVVTGPQGGVLLLADVQNPATFVTASKSGSYNLFWEENNNGCLHSDIVIIGFGDIPTTTNLSVDCDATGQFYTVSFSINATAPPYLVNGQPIAGSLFTSPPIVSGVAYNFVVTDANGCKSLPISGIKNCNCLSDAGQMSATILSVCEGQTAQATPPVSPKLDGNDAGSYILQNLGSGSLGQILAENKTGAFGFLPNSMTFGTTYFISFVVGNDSLGLPNLNDPCLSVSAGQPVVFNQIPSADAGIDQVLCGNTIDFSANQLGQGQWTTVMKPAAATVIFGNSGAATTSATITGAGIFEFQWKITQNNCVDSDRVQINLSAGPVAGAVQKNCNASATQYELTFTISGGNAPYMVTGVNGQLVGNQFVSALLPNNSSYSITISDAAGCTSLMNGNHNCNCSQFAGTMSQTAISACEGSAANAQFTGGNVQNAGDTLFYILHNGALTNIGTIYQSSATPQFSYQPSLIFGQTYFISAIVTSILPNGQPDFNDPCLNLAQGQPVVFHPKPSATLSGDATICKGEPVTLTFDCVGDGPFVVNYSVGAQVFTQNVDVNGLFLKDVIPAVSTTYVLNSVTDGNLPACSATQTGQVKIEVGQPTSAVVQPSLTVCNNALFGSIVDFSNLILSGDATGNWVDLNNSGSAGSFPIRNFNGLAAGTYLFKYTTAAAQNPCPQQSYIIEILVDNCQCPSVETNAPAALCNGNGVLNLPSITMTSAPGVWTITNAPLGNAAIIENDQINVTGSATGIYELTFTLQPPPQAGCPTNSVENLMVSLGVSAGKSGAPVEFCQGETWTIDLLSLFADAPSLGGIWTETSVNPSVSGAFSAALGEISTKNLAAGTYKFKYAISGVAPCPSDEETVTVLIRANPVADAGPDLELDCFGTNVILGGTATTIGADIAYFWEKDGQAILLANELNLAANKTGIFTLKVVESPLGCKNSDEATILQAVAASAIFPKTVPNLCFGQSFGSISLDSIAGGASPFLYALNGSAFSNVNFWTNLAAGVYEIKIQDVKGCELIDSVEIAAPLELTVNLGSDTLINLGESLTIFANILPPQAAIDTIIWSPILSVLQVGLPEQSFQPFASRLLTVTVIDTNGCRAKDEVLIEVDKTRHIYVPNIFAPETNENGLFTIYGGQDVSKIKSFQVFDRWGEMMFDSPSFDPKTDIIGWDGQFNGQKMTSAVFVWWAEVIFIDGEVKLYKGDVTLSR